MLPRETKTRHPAPPDTPPFRTCRVKKCKTQKRQSGGKRDICSGVAQAVAICKQRHTSGVRFLYEYNNNYNATTCDVRT